MPSHTSAYVWPGLQSAIVMAPLGLTKRVASSYVKRLPRGRAGGKSIAGEVDVLTTPTAGRIVRAYDRATGVLLREVTTDSAGLYAFPDLDGRFTYYVVALDAQPGGYNAAVADYITPT